MRKFALLALLFSLCLGGAAFAQDATPVYCGALSDADCAILTNSQAAMHTLDSASFDLTVSATVTNAPDMKEPLTFSLVGNGSYSGMNSLQSSMLAMMSAQSMQNPAQFYVDLLENLDADITLTLALPPELMRESNSTFPSNITLQARLVDGVGYVNLDPLQPFINQPNLKGWGGLDLANLLKGVLERQPDLFSNMEMFAMNSTDMSATMHQFTDPAFLNQFLTISRTDDGSGDTATFHVTVDFAALMSSPAMRDMMMQQMQMQMRGQTVTEEQVQQAMMMSAQMMQGMTFSLDEEIGLSDGFVHSVHGTFAFDTSGMMMGMNSGSSKKQSASTGQGSPSVNVDFTLTFRDFNSAAPITAPTQVMILPYQLLLSSMPTPVPTMTVPPPVFPTATATGTVEVTAEPTSEATVEPTAEVTNVVPEPTAEVTDVVPEPTVVPTLEPTAEVTVTS